MEQTIEIQDNQENNQDFKEQKIISELEELKKDFKNNLIFGTQRTLKLLRQSKLSKIYLASNVPENIRKDIDYYSKLSNIKVINLNIPNDELGIFCKKQFSVAVIGLVKSF